MNAKLDKGPAMPDQISVETVRRILAKHGQVYKRIAPVYQTALLNDLRNLWNPSHRRMLDVGGGTGVIAEAMKDLFAIESVVSIDVEDRFKEDLTIETGVFDGVSVPFPDNSFDCVTVCNVIHHVSKTSRVDLMRECARVVGGGPVYVKDHISASALDSFTLFVEDVIGNAPYGGQIKAWYLSKEDWEALAAESGFRIDCAARGEYRSGMFKLIFPSKLEIAMRWLPVEYSENSDRRAMTRAGTQNGDHEPPKIVSLRLCLGLSRTRP
jgi:SAM-dependent methyltransferase